MVWMAQRLGKAENNEDEEFVAIKNIHIKDKKGSVYAEREIRILQELRHPNIIRLIRAYDLFNSTRLVVMQLARGPNLHQLVVKRGALGLPLCRLVSRQLIAAVGYLHGRAVIHRGTFRYIMLLRQAIVNDCCSTAFLKLYFEILLILSPLSLRSRKTSNRAIASLLALTFRPRTTMTGTLTTRFGKTAKRLSKWYSRTSGN